MTFDDFANDPDFHGTISYYDDEPAAKPSKFVLIIALFSVIFGGLLAIISVVDIFSNDIKLFGASILSGLLCYFLTLIIPAFFIIYLRNYHFKHSMPGEDGEFPNYDSHGTAKVARKMRAIAVAGFVLSLFSIFVIVWPISQKGGF